ncbi:MAG: hypothetical protein R2756_11155 [Bacteroidales bacterium]
MDQSRQRRKSQLILLMQITVSPPCTLFRKGTSGITGNTVTLSAGIDYWEGAVIRPDHLLEDLVSIIHPELMPGYE